jgi:DNA-binding CsgD family transcriptional regulator
LTGRAEELRFVDAAFRRTGGQRGVVLAGAAGVGKTRLARETLAAAQQRGVSTRWATGTSSAQGLPLGAFAALIGELGGDPIRVLQHAAEALLSGAGRLGVMVGVDDAHLLDEMSALLVHQLVLHEQATVVVTVRTGERVPDAVTALWKDDHLDRLELQPLSEPETAALLEAVLDGPLDSAAAARMWALTDGNPLYLRQLVDGELAAGRLHQSGGVWRWAGHPQLGPGLVELIDTRIGRLSDPIQDVVDVLAVGEPLGVALLGELTDSGAVERAEVDGLVSVQRDGRRLEARLAHPLYGEARRAVIGSLRARRLRGLVARALANTGGRRTDDTLRRAVLSVDSDLEPDPALLAAAAHRAVQRLDMPLAERLSRAAVEAGSRFEARLILAHALGWQGRGVDAEQQLVALTDAAGTDVQRAQAAFAYAGNVFWTLARPADAESLLAAAATTLGDADLRRGLVAMQAAFHAFLGRPEQALRAAAAALDSPRLPDQGVVLATWGRVLGLGLQGLADQLDVVASRGYAAAARSHAVGDAALGFFLTDLHLSGLRLAGYLSEGEALALEGRERTRQVPGLLSLYGIALTGHAALSRGQLATAIRLLREARSGLAPIKNDSWAFESLVGLTRALAMSGDAVAARKALIELHAQRHPGMAFLDPEIVLAQAWVAAAEGALSEAITLAHQAAQLAADRGQHAQEVLALQNAVSFGDRTPTARLAELCTRVDGPRARAAAAHAAALAAGDGAGLEAASARLEAMGDLLAAADATAQAAVVYTSRGERGHGHIAAARAHRLAAACEGARTPALLGVDRPMPLTDREREIITLAAQGQSNREIAARLTVSVRTVEGHLYRACAKLGVSTRAELTALLQGT